MKISEGPGFKGKLAQFMQYKLKDLVIDTVQRTVRQDGKTVQLPELSFDLLANLVEAAPKPMSGEDLSATVWRAEHVTNDTIAQRIALLRKALGDDPKNPRYVRTVRGFGYAIVGSVERVETHSSARPERSKLDLRKFASAAALIVVSAGSLILFSQTTTQPETVADTANQETTSPTDLLVERALSQLRLHQPEETERAIAMLRSATAQEPTSFNARLALSFALSTSATKFRGDWAEEREAETIARALINERPDNSNAWSALGYTLSAQGRSDEALAAYRQAFELNPGNASALSSAAHLLLLKGDLQQALMLEVQARKSGNSRYAEIQIAQVLELIDHPSATRWRDQALNLNPGQVVVLKEVAATYLRRGEPDDALEIIAQFDGDLASAPQLMVLQGRALIMLDRMDDAEAVLTQAGWRGHFLLAAMDAATGDGDLAETYFPKHKRVELAAQPDPELIVQLAEVEAALGNEETATQFVSIAISLGWRDVRWLSQSPYLRSLMSTEIGEQISDRIARELTAQRELIEGTMELDAILRTET